jgi:putative ABC transport system permease protein
VTGKISFLRLARQTAGAFSGSIGVLALVTLGLAVLATAIPRSVDGFLTEGLRYDAAQTSAISRDVISDHDGLLEYGPGERPIPGMTSSANDVWGNVDDDLERLRQGLPQPLRETVGPADYTVVTNPAPSQPYGKVLAEVSVGYDPRFLSRVELSRGRPPEEGSTSIPSAAPVEVIASSSVADTLSWDLGGTRTLFLPDRLNQDLVLVGIFEAQDAAAPYWVHTPATLEATVLSTPPSIHATVFADAAGVEAAVGSALITRSAVWFPVDADDLSVPNATALAQQVRKFTSISQTVGEATSLAYSSDLPEVLEAAERRNASSQAILGIVLAGPLGLVAAIEVLMVKLVSVRLRPSVILLAARGASVRQRRLLLGLPTLVVGIGATAIGVFLASFLPGGALSTWAAIAIAAVALAPAALLVALGADPDSQNSPTRGAAWLRTAGESLVVLATVAAVVTVTQQRHENVTSSGTDLLGAATPLLLSLLGCVIALRTYPLVLRRWLKTARGRPGLPPMMGISRALRAGSGSLVPLASVLIGVSVALFSGVLTSTLSSGVESAAEARVGADLAVDHVRLNALQIDQIRSTAGVAAAAGVSTDVFHYLVADGAKPITVTAILVDPGDVAEVQAGLKGAIEIPSAISGDDTEAVPLVVSTSVSEKLFRETNAHLDRNAVHIHGASQVGQFFGTSDAWVLADRRNADGITFSEPDIADQVLIRLQPGTSVKRVESNLREIAGENAEFSTPGEASVRFDSNPAVGGVRSAAVLAIVGSGLLGLAALGLATVVDTRARRRSLTLLGYLGLSRRQGLLSVMWEFAPLAVVGVTVGGALGAVLSSFMIWTIDLRPFTAGIEQPPASIDWLLTAAIFLSSVLLLGGTAFAAATNAVVRRRSRVASDTLQDWNS